MDAYVTGLYLKDIMVCTNVIFQAILIFWKDFSNHNTVCK